MTASRYIPPVHVPKDLFWDNSLEEFCRQGDDPYVAAARLYDLEGPGIIWARDASFGNPGWVLTRYATIEQGFLDWEHFSSRNNLMGPLLGVSWPLIPVEVDPPDHHAYRQILMPFFTGPAINALEAPVREICNSLVAKFESRGSCEFISEFALQFPSFVFLELVGMPRDMLPQFLAWEHDIIRGEPAQRVAAARAILHYMEGFIVEQRKNPKSALVKAIVTAQVQGRPLTEDEVMGMLYLLYVAGLDTVYSTLGFVFRHLALDHSLQARLRKNPDDIPKAVEEFSRAFGVPMTQRRVATDFEFNGVPMKKGESVFLPVYLASRDPGVYKDPHTIDIDRGARTLTFATGPHACVGLRLAKREMRVVIETFLSQFRNIRMVPGEAYEYHTGNFGVDRLMLQWDR